MVLALTDSLPQPRHLQGTTRHYQRLVSQTTLLRILQGQKGQRVRIVILCLGRIIATNEFPAHGSCSRPARAALVVHATCQCRTPLATISACYNMTALTHKPARGHKKNNCVQQDYLLCSTVLVFRLSSPVSRLPSRLASARLMGRSSYFQNPPHSLAISNGRRWGFDGPVQRTGARAGSVQRSRKTHSAVHARGSTGPSSVVGRTSVLDPALWEDGVLRELPAGAPASDSRQSAPSPSGPAAAGRALGRD